jgi:hypothetical protein
VRRRRIDEGRGVECLTYTLPEARQALGIGATLLTELVRSGQIPSIVIGKRRLISKAVIQDIVAHGIAPQSLRIIKEPRRAAQR